MPARFKPDFRIYKRYYTNVRYLYRRRDVVVYTGLTFSFLAIALFGLFALKPTITTIAGLAKEIKVKREFDQKLEKRLEILRLAQENYAQVIDSKALVVEALPEKPYLAQLVYQIEGLSQELNLTIVSLSFGEVTLVGKKPTEKNPGEKPTGPEEISFTIRVSGDYENLLEFLNATEGIRRLIKVESFDFKTIEEETGLPSIQLNVAGIAYFL